MKKCAILFAFAWVAAPLTSVHAVSPFVKERQQRAEKKAKEREERAKEKENKPAPVAKPERPKRDDKDDHPYSRDKNRDRDRNKNRKDRDDWKRPRTVIIERPVYVPTFPTPGYDPYGTNPYGYGIPVPYDAVGAREDALLEAVAKQMRFALRENPILKSFNLDTDTVGDSVEIEGQVDTLQQLQLALDVARDIDPRTRIVITRIKIRQNQTEN